MASEPGLQIVICMGSSCFARGNAENLRLLQEYLQRHRLQASVRIRGQLCHENCKRGPNLTIGDRLFSGISPQSLPALLDAELKPRLS